MRGLILLLEFVAITAPLTWLWMNGGQDAYMAFFKDVARPALIALGVTNYPPSAVRDRFVGFIPFIALMLITPGLEWRKRLGGLLLGFPIIVLCQVGLVFAVFKIVVQGGGWNEETKTALFPFTVIFDAMPLLLWAVFAHEYLGGLLERIIPPTPAPSSTPRPAARSDSPAAARADASPGGHADARPAEPEADAPADEPEEGERAAPREPDAS